MISTQDFHRYCRLLHGWLSAIAFLALCFFSVTGLLLNHPQWTEGEPPAPVTKTVQLDPQAVKRIELADDPGAVLAEIAAAHAALRGEYSSGDRAGPDVFARLQGVRGLTDVRVNLPTGRLEIVIEPAPATLVMNELHRAERASPSWRLLVDVVAVLLIVLSLIGYLIFLSMRFRLRTALLLTLVSAAGMWTLFSLTVH
ncbi:MAG TPA: PepSY-associated TM helix domain-containing protein [Povalibacter sp.]|uniref:PepSY-associated TM helix domain-containing protein n=1 Tax=Povalibacter sp. TaxID=1962978 RepID=UPI002B695094|nr:PepSY-associated TM helix domain-containing protein [Povalibacter sp.]HMN46464.1 PepSY-associated TM helix domain-containing protein [Povalibacter sp.]